MKNVFISLSLLFVTPLLSQVGINNSNPNATLDIEATNLMTPSSEDGILIPRVNDFPSVNPGAAQDGMMIFVTGDGAPPKGFYYWDDDAGSWISINGDKNTLDEGYDQGGAGAGRIITADNGAVEIQNTGGLRVEGAILAATNIVHDGDSNTLVAFTPDRIRIDAGGRNYMDIHHSGTEITFNEDSTQSDFRVESDTNTHMLFVDGSVNAIGINNTTPNVELDVIGRAEITDSGILATGSPLSVIRNAETNGAAIFAETTPTYSLRTYAAIETANALTNLAVEVNKFETGTNYKSGLLVTGLDAVGERGVVVAMNNPTTLNYIADTPTFLSNILYNGGASGNVFGYKSEISGSGAAGKYGFHAQIPNTSGGVHYGMYSDVQKSTGYAAYLIGRTSLGNTSSNRYLMPAADGTAGQVMTTDGAGNVTFATISGGGVTLDGAYDFGGAGSGRTISADNGAVSIEGTDGFQVTGTYNSGAVLALSGAGSRLFFNPRKGAFRVGRVDGTQWDIGNVGNFSMSIGNNTIASGISSIAIGNSATASGNSSVALGLSTIASGTNSTAFGSANTATGINSTAYGFANTASGYGSVALGYQNTAHSSFETVLGTYATNYTPVASSSTVTDPSDRVLVVGNGTSNVLRSNALTLYKDGSLNINDAYTLPNADGTANQVLTTDGAGNTSWASVSGTTTSIVRALLSASQLLPSGTTKILFDATLFDTNTDFDTTNNRFVAPRDGYYRVNCAVAASNSSAGGLFLNIYKNGVIYQRDNLGTSANSQFKTIHGIVALNAGEYVEIFVAASPANYSVSSNAAYTFFEIQEIK
ncbi:MAG: hypothetical protein R2776_01165 [Flavobacteriaceae bacterium]